VRDRLEETLSGYKYVLPNATIENYNADGRLLTISRFGHVHTLTYNGLGQITSVSDDFGRSLQFTYFPDCRLLHTMTDPAGNVYTYDYDSIGNITTVTYPNTKTRVYQYGTSGHRYRLLSITDEKGNQVATWTYDSNGRAISSEHAGGVDHVDITYNGDYTATVTDLKGKARTYNFVLLQGVKKLTQVDVPCSSCGTFSANLTYDSNGFIDSRTDFEGNITNLVNNSRGLVTSRTEAVGTPEERIITTTWHPDFALPTLVTEPGRTTAFTYTNDGRILTRTETDTTGNSNQVRTWTYTYNAQNLLETIDGPRTDVSDVTTFTYDPINGNLLSIQNALSHTTTFTSHDGNGRPLTYTDPNGLAVTLTYDFRGRLLTRTAGSRTTTYTYDDAGLLTRVTWPTGTYIEYVYDAAHRLYEIKDNLGNRIHYTLDDMGNRAQEEIFDPGDVLRHTLSRTYDEFNRLYEVLNAQANATTFSHDKNGNITQIKDPLLNAKDYAYDALSRLKQVTDDLAGVTQYTYNAQDRVTSVTDPGGVQTGYTYDGLGSLMAKASPDSGNESYTYDPAGNRITHTDARGIVATWAYDALNRPLSLTYPTPGEDISLTFDQGANGKGHLTARTDPSGSYAFTYDAWGNLTREDKTILSVGYTTEYAYDQDSQIASITYPSGRVVEFERDAAGRITAVKTDGGTQIIAQNITYAPFGPISGWDFGNGINFTRTFDQNYWLTHQSSFQVQSADYGHDLAGNINLIDDLLLPARSQNFVFDDLYRLTSATGLYGSISYTYDANGNRLSKTVGGQTDTYTYTPGSNRLASITGANPETFTHDDNGSITARLNTTLTYGQDKRLKQVVVGGSQTTGYVINAQGQRVIKTSGGGSTVFHYDQEGNLIAESGAAGNTLKEYVYLYGVLLAVIDPSGTVYAHNNYRYEPVALTDATATVVWESISTPFGEASVDEDPDGDLNPYQFNIRLPGQYYDSETGMHYNYYRDYYPGVGRYIQFDPIGPDEGVSIYGYVDNDPINLIDKYGLHGFPLFGRPPTYYRGFPRIPRPIPTKSPPRQTPTKPPRPFDSSPPPDIGPQPGPLSKIMELIAEILSHFGNFALPPVSPALPSPEEDKPKQDDNCLEEKKKKEELPDWIPGPFGEPVPTVT
jgi:RHS repeat-associated protein